MEYYNTVVEKSNLKTYAPWLIFVAAALWGTEAPLRKFLIRDLSSWAIVFSEHMIIGLVALPLFLRNVRELKHLNLKGWLSLIFVALGGSTLGTIFYTESFRYVNPSVSILLQKTQPFIALLLAFLILKEKLRRGFYIWAVLAILGGYFVSFPEIRPEPLSFSRGTIGVLFALLASFFWGGSTVFGRYLLFKINFQAMTSLRFLLALLFLSLISLSSGGPRAYRAISQKDVLYLVLLALIAGFVALLFYYRGLKDTKASVSTIAELVYPLSAVTINWIVLGASLRPGQIIGGVLLLFSIWQVSRPDTIEPVAAVEPVRDHP